MNTAVHHYRSGMGDACGQGAATVHMAVGGGLATAGAIAMAIPGGLIAGAVLEVAGLISNFFGHPDCSKIAATSVVNQAEQLLKQNLAAWQSLPANQKNVSTQQVALANFDGVWQQVIQACGQIGGSAGQACVADRQQGACHYQNNGCWNWFVGYRDPIASDPAVQADTVLGSSAADGSVGSVGGISPLWIGIALLGGALLMAEVAS